ncbi:MAG: ABC transporter ATP-binding protein, partial [Chloroflexota bacterium]
MIATRDLRRTFKSRKSEVEAVRGVDLNVAAGEIFGFLGPNGAGKTTTLRMLATLLLPTSGEATVAGADLRRESQQVRERIGYVPQGGSTDPAETGRGELVLQGRLYGMNKAAAEARAAEVLAALDLDAAADRTTSTYSGGMKRRLDVGLGIVHKPSVLFLDEPTTGLDPQARARMWDEIRLLRDVGTTVFLTTHYLEEADALADRLAIID